jgi:hypothetical protein
MSASVHTGQGPDRDAAKVNSAVQLDRPCLVGEILTSTISVNTEWQRVSSIIIVRSSAAVFFSLEATVRVSPALSDERSYARGWLPDRSPDQMAFKTVLDGCWCQLLQLTVASFRPRYLSWISHWCTRANARVSRLQYINRHCRNPSRASADRVRSATIRWNAADASPPSAMSRSP